MRLPVAMLLERLHRLGAELVVTGPAHSRQLYWLALPKGMTVMESWALVSPMLPQLIAALDVPRCRYCKAAAPAPGLACTPCELMRLSAVIGYSQRQGIDHLVRRDGRYLCNTQLTAGHTLSAARRSEWLCARCVAVRDRRRVLFRPADRIPRDAWGKK